MILFEDNHLLVVAKPAGLPTMGAEKGHLSLLDLAREYIREKYRKPGNVYLGVVSRIDSFVSGVIVLARTSKAASRLTEQFKAGSVKKNYYAILEGRLSKKFPQRSGRLESWLRKNDRLRRVESFPREVSGSKRAELAFRIVDENDSHSLVDIDLLTGRKHQIRTQFSDLGFPVFGDRKYDAREHLKSRIALHAYRLVLQHPTLRENRAFMAPIPDAWHQQGNFPTLLKKI